MMCLLAHPLSRATSQEAPALSVLGRGRMLLTMLMRNLPSWVGLMVEIAAFTPLDHPVIW